MFYINYLSIRIYSLIYRNRYITGWIELLSYSQQISMGSVAYSGIIKRDKVFALWELKFWWRRWKIRQCLCNKVSLLIHTEKEMATHSSVLAWRIPGTGEPGWLPSMGSHRVGHDWSDLAAATAADTYTLRGKAKHEEMPTDSFINTWQYLLILWWC